MRFRFATWNVNAFRRLSCHAALIRSVECDLLALQELTQTSYDNLAASGLFDWSAFSLTLRPPQPGEGRARSLGCALFGRTPFTLSSFRLLESVRLPERTLIATLETPSGPLTACSFHAPPGATWKAVKPQTFVYIANWLVDHPQRMIFGMDANTPAADHPDSNKIRWHWVDEPVLLGHNAEHTLRDVFRTYLAAHPEELEEIRRVRPEGPLAISYDRGKLKGKFIPCRYDCICASPDLQVERMEYLYDEGLQAGSDHALVIATMRCEG